MMVATCASRRFATLDGLRGVAALLVAVYHFRQYRGGSNAPGYLAVDLFFVLSGFVIARIYTPRLAAGLSVQRFAAIRLTRLYPLYLAGLLLGLVAQMLRHGWQMPEAFSLPTIAMAVPWGAVMLPDPFHNTLFPLNGSAWSLFFELVVNLCFALFLWRAPTRWIVTMILLAAGILAEQVRWPHYYNLGWEQPGFLGGLARATFGFGAGIVLFRTLTPRRRTGWLAMLPIAALSAILLIDQPPIDRALWEVGCACIAFPVLVAIAVLVEPPAVLRGWCARAGWLSYPLYAVHWPIAAVIGPLTRSWNPWASGALFLIVSIGIAVTAARMMEPAIAAWLSTRFQAAWWADRDVVTTTSAAAP